MCTNIFQIKNFSIKKFIYAFILSSFFTFIFTLFSTNLYTKIFFFNNNDIPKSSYIFFDFGLENQQIMIFHYKSFHEHKYNFLFEKPGTMVLSGLENKDVVFSKVSVNKKTYIDNNTGLSPAKIYYNFNANEKIKVSIVSKKNTLQLNIIDYINMPALIIVILCYFCTFFYIFFKKNHINYIKNFIIRNKDPILLFLYIFLIYILLFKNFYLYIDYFRNYIVGSDVPWVIEDIFSPTIRRFHPYFFTCFYPLLEFLLFFTQDKFLSLGILYSIIASLTCVFIYKSLFLLLKKYKSIAILLTLIYAFSFCQIVFTAFFETYMLTSFYLSIITFLIINESLAERSSKINLFLIVLFSALAFGVSISNIIPISVLIATSLYIKYRNKKKIMQIFLYILIFIIAFLLFKYLTAEKLLLDSLFDKAEINNYLYKTKLGQSILNFAKTSLYELIIAPKLFIRNGFGICIDTLITVNFDGYTNFQKIFANSFLFSFIVLWLFSFFYTIKSFNIKHKAIFYSISTTLLVNFILLILWSSEDGFLFALSHFLLWFIIFAYSFNNLLETTNKKNIYYLIIFLLVFFLIFTIINNFSSLNLIYEQSYKIFNEGL